MSENKNIPLSPEAKAKLKKILPVVTVVVVLLVIITACFGGNSGKSVNKEATKALYKQNPKKILAMMPKGYEDDVIDYYGDYVKDKKELKEAVKQETSSVFEQLGKIKKFNFKENFKVSFDDLSGSGLNSIEEATVKEMYNGISAIWKEIKECEDGYVSKVDIIYKDEDGEKQTYETLFCSFKYKGKWYSMNAMDAVYHAAWGYNG